MSIKDFAIGFQTDGFMLGFLVMKGVVWTDINLYLGLVIVNYRITHKRKI